MKFLTPYYTIADDVGKSGRILWAKRIGPLFICCFTPQIVGFHTEPPFSNFNPYFDLQHNSLMLGWKGNNYGIQWTWTL